MHLTVDERRVLSRCANAVAAAHPLGPRDFNVEGYALVQRLIHLRLLDVTWSPNAAYRTYYLTCSGREELATR